MRAALAALDHLIWVTPDLEAGIAALESRLGVRAAIGGRHPGRGTRNALLSLGTGIYLEILAPDPGQSALAKPRWLGVDAPGSPRLTAWMAKSADVAGDVMTAARAGVRLGAAIAGGREASDGARLTWTVSDPDIVVSGGVVPVLIDWGATPHPSLSAPAGGRLSALCGEHPDAATVREQLRALDIEMDVRMGEAPALIATIETTRGEVTLR